MNRGVAFIKKEWMEQLRTGKLLVTVSIFLIFGFLSPLLARYINEILQMAAGPESLKGLVLETPKWIDAYAQFYKNNNSMCMIVLILISMGSVVNEKRTGTYLLMHTRGLSSGWFILSKFVSIAAVFTLAYCLGALGTWFYTQYLFPDFAPNRLIGSMLLYWLYGLFIVALTLFVSTVVKSMAAAAIGSLGSLAVLGIISGIEFIKPYSPTLLSSLPLQILQGIKADHLTTAMVSTLLLTLLALTGSVFLLNKQEIWDHV